MKNAFTYRNVLCGGLVYAALGLVQIASAGFAQPSPPSGFSYSPANEPQFRTDQWVNGSARSSADLNVAGRRVQIPVYFRVSAANAPQFAARYLFRHPLVAAAGAASLLAPLAIEFANGQWNRTEVPSHNYPISDGFIWSTIYGTTYFSVSPGLTPVEHCNMHFAESGQICRFQRFDNTSQIIFRIRTSDNTTIFGHRYNRSNNARCPAGWIITPAGCVQTAPPVTRPLTEEEFVPLVAPRISPAQVPDILPDHVPIPVERPVPRPLIVPLADPVIIPNIEPQQWRQPLVQINPSPTVDNPWRVSLNPKERITTSPYGITQPVSELDPATPAQPTPDSDFCIRNPGILACAPVPVFDVPVEQISTVTQLVTYQPEHFLGGGACPQPVTVNLGGTTIVAFDTPLYCQFISSYFRPVLLAIAAFASMMIVAGGFRSV